MGIAEWIRARLLDTVMSQMNELRPATLEGAGGSILEIGFGTGLNLDHYPPGVKSLTGVDPDVHPGYAKLQARLEQAPFPIERHALRADGGLPFDDARFDCVVTTWTLCSIDEPVPALEEMRRVLKPGGRYFFIEHGRAPKDSTQRWQDRLNPAWRRLAGGCNMNRAIDSLVAEGGFRLEGLERFRHKGPPVLAHMYRGTAIVA